MNTLRIARTVSTVIHSHGEHTYPHECCGILLGRNAHESLCIVASAEARNLRTDSLQNRYLISPAELIRIQHNAELQNFCVAGFYHSHPNHPAYWSSVDFERAYWLGHYYLITSIGRGKAGETRAFLLTGTCEEDKRFEEQRIEIFDFDEPLGK
jgi:proteasome lid subunit RPN8/RPN11